MADAVLHLIDANERSEAQDSCLSDQEQARAARFVFPHDASRWSYYRSCLRRILGESLGIDPLLVPLVEGPNGKPALAPPHDSLEFNLSHTDDLAALIVSHNGPVGIDLEPWSRAPSLIECADVFCHPDELKRLPSGDEQRATRLMEIWTAKEALLKALGTGLSYPPQHLRIDTDHGTSDTPLDHLCDFRILIPDHSKLVDYRMAVALSSGINGIEWSGSLPKS